MHERYRDILEQLRAVVSEVDTSGRVTYVSPTVEPILGYTPAELIERGGVHRVHPEDRPALRELLALTEASGASAKAVYRVRHKRGHWVWFESTGRSSRRPDGSSCAVLFGRDVTDQMRAERELRESEERYRLVTEATSDLISELDAEGRLVYASRTLLDVLGYSPEELVGTTPLALLLCPDDAELAAQAFLDGIEKSGPTRTAPYRMRHRDGSWRWFESTGVPYRRADGEIRMIAVTRDVTERIQADEERRQLESRMQQTQKLESLGVMAGGIAHDFNNLLTPILGDASLALMDLAADSPLRERLQRVQKAAHRAAALTNQMLAYAGKRPLVVENVNLSRLALEMARLLEASVSGRAVLSFEMAADVPPVQGDVAQLSQVVMNLVINASEAIGDRSGRIELCTGSVDSRRAAGSATFFGADLRDGPCVYLEVSDNGCGMDATTRERIFDPFFSTKFTGRGLGLAAVLGIVRGHRGAIEIQSEPGLGTRFRVVLPAADGATRRAGLAGAQAPWQGRGTALVLDDDEGVRELVRETLERAGLAVLCAADAREALRLYRHRPEQIDLVILDRTLPHSTGEEVFDVLRGIRPEVRVLLMSGYGEEVASARFAGKGLAGFLQKPFLPETLVERARAVLEG